MIKFKINYFDLGLHKGQELKWIVNDIFPRLGIENYSAYGFEACGKYAKKVKSYFIGEPRVEIMHNAVCGVQKDIKLYYANNAVGHSIFETKRNVNKEKFELVPGIVFSEWALKHVPDFKDCLNIMKINIEGAEWPLFNDLCSTGLASDIQIFCGAGHDVEKVGELQDKVEEYYDLLRQNNINFLRFTEWKPRKNADIEYEIKRQIMKFAPRHDQGNS